MRPAGRSRTPGDQLREALPGWEVLPMTIWLRLPNIAGMRSNNCAAAAAAAAIGTLLVAGCGPASRQASLPAATTPVPTTARTGPATGTPPVVAAASARQLPISIESDSQMRAEGNYGPSSSILLPASCRLTGTTITAEGTYTDGGFVPDVYDRYGAIIVLYVLAAPSPGYPEGMQLGASDVRESPAVGSRAPWHASMSVYQSAGVPARCVVAAQPTQNAQFAPAPTSSSSPATTASPGEQFPISVESDSQMRAEGNYGPSSSILLPASCRLTGTTITAEGTYTDGGFVPDVYDRHGDIIVLYVLAAPSPGYPEGMQLGASDVRESPAVGSRAPWHVRLPVYQSPGIPARCAVAAQPTHDAQFAP
jgi:hypothetical protein